MSIIVKGMEMPKSCFYCPFHEKVNPDDYVCMALNKEFEETFSLIVGKRHNDCPLVPVPPHGDLIGREWLIDIALHLMNTAKNDDIANGVKWLWQYIIESPTIISADKDGEENG